MALGFFNLPYKNRLQVELLAGRFWGVLIILWVKKITKIEQQVSKRETSGFYFHWGVKSSSTWARRQIMQDL